MTFIASFLQLRTTNQRITLNNKKKSRLVTFIT